MFHGVLKVIQKEKDMWITLRRDIFIFVNYSVHKMTGSCLTGKYTAQKI